MPFEFFGAKKKAVIAMAHIGALPGAPLYDAGGGVQKITTHLKVDGDTWKNVGRVGRFMAAVGKLR
jgi:predicted TIM-barrel enzyme